MKKKNMTLVYPISMSQSPSRCTPPFESPSPRVSPLSLPPPSPSVQVSPFESTPFEPHLPPSLCSFRMSPPSESPTSHVSHLPSLPFACLPLLSSPPLFEYPPLCIPLCLRCSMCTSPLVYPHSPCAILPPFQVTTPPNSSLFQVTHTPTETSLPHSTTPLL